MPRLSLESKTTRLTPNLYGVIMETATNPKAGNHRQRDIAGQVKAGTVKPPKKKMGRPTLYSEKTASLICERLSNGETLSVIVKDLSVNQDSVYTWLQKYPDFAERYKRAKENQAVSLLNELLDETKELQNDRALAMRVRSDLVKWYAAKTAPQQFGDSKVRIELSGEITHTHVHALADEQKKRIAEAWLLSQSENEPALIEGTAETSGPALSGLESVGVSQDNQEEERRVIPPKRKPQAAARKQKEAADTW